MAPIFEFLIALLLVFLLLSTIVSSLAEFYSSRIGRNSRAVLLYQALLKVFNDRHNRNYTDDLYRHPLIENSKPDEDKLPAYLEASVVARTLTDVLVREARPLTVTYTDAGRPQIQEPDIQPHEAFQLVRQSVQSMQPSEVKKLLQSFLHTSTSLPEVHQQIEVWYNAYMDRVTGWYKRQMRKRLLWVSFVVVLALNADLFRISAALWNDEKLRQPLVEQAVAITSDSTWLAQQKQLTLDQRKQQADSLYQSLKLSGLPVGWISELSPDATKKLRDKHRPQHSWWANVKFKFACFRQLINLNADRYLSISTLIGWLLMAFAVHLGAPFWFETLNKLVNLRGAGTRPQPAPANPPAK
jgi:hypothetical protein